MDAGGLDACSDSDSGIAASHAQTRAYAHPDDSDSLAANDSQAGGDSDDGFRDEAIVEADADAKLPTELRKWLYVQRVQLMYCTVTGKHIYADEEDGKDGADDKPLDEYGAFDANDEGANRLQILARAVQDELDKEWSAYDPEYGTTYEEERMVGKGADENPVADVKAPLVHAHNPPPVSEVCFCCKQKTASAYQTPECVFVVATRLVNAGFGVECVKELARLLVANNQVEARRRTACCRTVRCMLAQNILKYECYEAWARSLTARTQLERGTDRKDQGLTFSENIIFLRTLAVMSPPPLSNEELFALFEWLVLHAQWIQEREKRFIATAMAVVNNPHLFGYTFSDKQRFVDRMGSFVRKYALNVIFPHILVMDLKWGRWKSTANCLLETGMPKAPDVVYALLCEDNWEAWGKPMDANGRYEHRVPRGNPKSAELFTRDGFEEALMRCTHREGAKVDRKTGKKVQVAVQYRLNFSCDVDANGVGGGSGVGGSGSNKRSETQKLQKKISGSHRKQWTVGHAVAAPPTCGSEQANSGVHPRDRYENTFRAFDHNRQEAKAKADLFMQDYENGNDQGHEKQSANKDKAKACTVIRPITAYAPPPMVSTNATRMKEQLKVQGALIAMRPSKRKF
jgi:hypothetical protein